MKQEIVHQTIRIMIITRALSFPECRLEISELRRSSDFRESRPFHSTPTGLEDVSRYPQLLATLLEDPSWTEEDIKKLAGLNLLRVFAKVEQVRRHCLFFIGCRLHPFYDFVYDVVNRKHSSCSNKTRNPDCE